MKKPVFIGSGLDKYCTQLSGSTATCLCVRLQFLNRTLEMLQAYTEAYCRTSGTPLRRSFPCTLIFLSTECLYFSLDFTTSHNTDVVYGTFFMTNKTFSLPCVRRQVMVISDIRPILVDYMMHVMFAFLKLARCNGKYRKEKCYETLKELRNYNRKLFLCRHKNVSFFVIKKYFSTST